MRLLQRRSNGDIFLTPNLRDDAVPRYAILSHTWGSESEEVTFEDLTHGRGPGKAGYRKIKFCAEKAATDGLKYFWVDSCCIDKSNKAELQDAISSMFRWYQRSIKCYVYLADVSDGNTQNACEQAFRKSRWFTRGWTLQELLAPISIEFFSKEASRLGDNHSLEQQIHEITGIPHAALQGEPLARFSVNERLSWIESRQTTLVEDSAYSLLGIFGVNISLRYGEGRNTAFERLEREIDKLQNCLQDLRLTDPAHHKKHIEHIKGGLLEDSYRWILDNRDFRTWRNGRDSRLLWIKGDPGKGKTMLLCGIINELNKMRTKNDLLSYFFCEATNSRINNATAVLRGLIYMLVCQQPSLISHIRQKYDHAGKALFEDSDAWFALSDIFTDILQNHDLNLTWLIIDALDECVAADLPRLVEFIVEKSSLYPHVKWLVSSRNWFPIEERMRKAGSKVKLCLELNAESVSEAVSIYIQHKVHQLVQDWDYDNKTQNAILDHLLSNADNTFLWVALVCENLQGTPQGIVRTRLKSFPPGLDSLYGRMVTQISESKDSALCKHILASIATVYEPIRLAELASLVEMLEELSNDLRSLEEIVGLCGSFLIVRDQMIYFVHQSAKDYLLTRASDMIFPRGMKESHHEIFSRSLKVLSRKLRRDIYNLDSPGYAIEQVRKRKRDPLVAARYQCLYWIDHLCDSDPYEHADTKRSLEDRGPVEMFVREKYLYWLEAVSLCKGIPKGVLAMAKLEDVIKRTDSATLLNLVHDARRFIMYHKQAIEISPLQVYTSALIFSPSNSLIKQHFDNETPTWITIKPGIGAQWTTCLQTLEGHNSTVNSVAFSHDSKRLASASDDHMVRIWDVDSGTCLQTLKGHGGFISSVAFSHNSSLLASGSRDSMIKIWNVESGACLQTLEGHSSFISSVAFLSHLPQLASASNDCTVKIWDINSGTCLQTLKHHSSTVSSVTVSHDSTRLASASHDCTIKIWSTDSYRDPRTLRGHRDIVNSVAFTYDATRLASASDDGTVRIWNADTASCLQTIDAHSQACANSVHFSHDSMRLISASSDRTIKIWNAISGGCLQTLKGHSGTVNSVAFSHDSTRVISASHDCTIRIWDVSDSFGQTHDVEHIATVSAAAISHDQTLLATASYDRTIKIWNSSSGECMQTLDIGRSSTVESLAFSRDSALLTWRADYKAFLARRAIGGEYVVPGHKNKLLPAFTRGSSFSIEKILSNTDQATARVALSSSGEWITYNAEKLVWLPPEYRPSCIAVSGQMIVIGVGSGKVWWCTLAAPVVWR